MRPSPSDHPVASSSAPRAPARPASPRDLGATNDFGIRRGQVAWVPAVLSLLLATSILPGCGRSEEASAESDSARTTDLELFPRTVDPATLDSAVRELMADRLQRTLDRPADPEAWAAVADGWLAHARYDLAVDPANRAVELSPESARRRLLLAVAFEGNGEIEAALDQGLLSRARAPQEAFLAWRCAAWALDLGDLELAERLARKAIELDPEDVRGRHVLAMVLLAGGDELQAEAITEEIIRSNPSDRAARYLRGRALRSLGREEEAVAQLLVAGPARPVFIDPWTLEVRRDRVDLTQRLEDVLNLAARGRAEEARALLATLEARYGTGRQVLFGRVAMRAMLGDHAGVIESADVVIAVDDDWAPPRLRAGLAAITLAQRGEGDREALLQRASDEGRRCIELTPGDPESHELLGRADAARGDWVAALAAFRRCLEIDPSTLRFHLAVGECLLETGEPVEAVLHLRGMDETFGRSVDSALVQARCYAVLGRLDDARLILNQCREAAPEHPRIPTVERAILEASG